MRKSKQHFYSHLITIEPLMATLDLITITDDQKREIIELVESTTHYLVVDRVMSELDDVDKKKLLSHIQRDDHKKIWDLLNKKVSDVEHKIRLSVRDVHLSMIDDIERVVKK